MTKNYFAILDLLDRGQYEVAAQRFREWTIDGLFDRMEFMLLLNAFVSAQATPRKVAGEATSEPNAD